MKKIIIVAIIAILISCKQENKKNGKLQIVTTTTMLTDLVKNIVGDKMIVKGLMGTGVDPHLYKASEGDVTKLSTADVIVYNGLHLEGKLEELFEKMEQRNKNMIVAADAINKSELIASENFSGNFDPHIWFDTSIWMKITSHITEKLSKIDAKNADFYKKNAKNYLKQLEDLNTAIINKINELPKEQRYLVTAHDAFNYFGSRYKFNVVGLQELSTATEAGVQDSQRLVKFIIDKKIKAIFVESSVPRRTIESIQQAVKSKNYEVKIGGTLYSDALGSKGTPEETYIGMYKTNINTIVNALK